ncbi:hypothetical protein RHMOL_Rhmol01G0122700 [Rhododendron molle]|nr:hypothetical protein RHMOL_Rhmol01G0122700 [Rhododendron molle]
MAGFGRDRSVRLIEKQDLSSNVPEAAALNRERLEANVKLHGEIKSQYRWPEIWVMGCGLLLALSFFKYVYQPFQWLAVGAVAVGILPIIFKSIAAIRNCTLNVNILILIAVGGTLALQDFSEAGTIVFIYAISQWLESTASYKALAVMSLLTSIAPQKAILAESGSQVDVKDVPLNTVVIVKAGDAIPIDGIVVEGQSEVDEKMLTGEPFPVFKQLNDTVWAGTINLNGYIKVKTVAIAEDCVVARMTKLVEDSHRRKSKTERLVDTCAKYYIPGVVLLSAGLAVIPAALRVDNETQWFYLAIVVLVSGCPCALILSTPVANFCALTKAATTGLLVKGGEYLEILAKVKTVAFDKTGTITRGEFVVTDFQCLCDDISFNTLLYWVSSIESKSSHPMAAALVDYSRLHAIEPKPEDVQDFQNFPGEGISGKIDGKYIHVGNRRIAARAGCTTEAVPNKLEDALDEVRAELLPVDKATIIQDLKNKGTVAMIGDGMNDAPALATADIGISMGISGSALATETGDMILMSNDIRKIPEAVRLARRARKKLIENVILSITVKGAILVLALAGYPLIWAAVVADVGTCLIVIMNSMLLLQGTPNPEEKKKFRKSSPSSGNQKSGCNTSDCHTPLISNCCSSSVVTERCETQDCSSSGQVEPSTSKLCKNDKCTDLQCMGGISEGDGRSSNVVLGAGADTMPENSSDIIEKKEIFCSCKNLKDEYFRKDEHLGAGPEKSLSEIIIH